MIVQTGENDSGFRMARVFGSAELQAFTIFLFLQGGLFEVQGQHWRMGRHVANIPRFPSKRTSLESSLALELGLCG